MGVPVQRKQTQTHGFPPQIFNSFAMIQNIAVNLNFKSTVGFN